MKLGIMADSHDRVPAIAELLRRFTEAKCELVLHAGDFCSPFALSPFIQTNLPVVGVFGRNDGDQQGLLAQAAKGMAIELYESPHSFEVSGKQILIVHDIGEVGKRSIVGHELVIHGCSHQVEMKTRGNAVMLNPGEACGWLYGAPSAAVLDVQTKKVEFIHLEGPEWRR